MNRIKSSLIYFIISSVIFFLFFSLIPSRVHAAVYDLVAPSGQFQRGQEVQFTINIDTEGKTLTTATIGMTYESNPLQYISTTPGDSFSTINVQTPETGKLIFTASNQKGFSGAGTFAIVTFKIIADAPGDAELCVLFNPETPTSPPAPTTLPETGIINQTNKGILTGIILLLFASGILIFQHSKPYKSYKHSNLPTNTPKHLKQHKTLH